MKRKIPTSITDYIHSLGEVRIVINFIRKEMVDKKSKRYIWQMFILSTLVILCLLLSPLAIGAVFSGLAEYLAMSLPGHRSISLLVHNPNMHSAFVEVSLGLFFTGILLFIQKLLDRYKAKAREWIIGIHWSNMDRRMTELFFEKSCGQHIQEDALAVSGIDKGRWNLLGIQTLIFFDAIPAANQVVISLVLLLFVSVFSSGLMLLAVLTYIAYSLYLNWNVMKVCTPIDQSFRRLNRRRYERMEKVIRVKVSGQPVRELREMTDWFDREMEKDRSFWLWFIEKSTWRSAINIALYMFVLCYGVYLVVNGTWNIGMIYPLSQWGTRIIENIWLLAEVEQKINWSLPSIIHMIKALSIPPDTLEASDPISLPHTPHRIVLENIIHSYPVGNPFRGDPDMDEEDEENDNPEREEVPHTLKHVGFSIEPGEKVALLGPSGAGKTTLMRLLLRFMDPDEGTITVGGYELKTIARDSWVRGIGYIAQHAEVFDGTIRDNLTYRLTDEERSNIRDEELWSLMRRLEIDFGTRLDKGLDTKVGKHGLKLSGGQAQRLMIGAAVIGNPWFMVIDEATSSLDSTTERKVQKGLSEILSGNTSALIVAHRLSTVRHLCTKFIVLRPAEEVPDGTSQVEAIGHSFEELYDTSPTFRQLANDQGIVLSTALAT